MSSPQSALERSLQETPEQLAKEAIRHVLNAIAEDPAKYYLLGFGTGSWDKLTKAHAALFDWEVEETRRQFQPRKDRYERFRLEREQNHRILEFCREKGISVGEDGRIKVSETIDRSESEVAA